MKRITTLLGALLLVLCFGAGQAVAADGDGAAQTAGQSAPSGQTADGAGSAYQAGPSNSAGSIRVLSPGNGGAVSQSNNTTAAAIESWGARSGSQACCWGPMPQTGTTCRNSQTRPSTSPISPWACSRFGRGRTEKSTSSCDTHGDAGAKVDQCGGEKGGQLPVRDGQSNRGPSRAALDRTISFEPDRDRRSSPVVRRLGKNAHRANPILRRVPRMRPCGIRAAHARHGVRRASVSVARPRRQGISRPSVLATLKPSLRNMRRSGWPMMRLAEWRCSGPLTQDPPRWTRYAQSPDVTAEPSTFVHAGGD